MKHKNLINELYLLIDKKDNDILSVNKYRNNIIDNINLLIDKKEDDYTIIITDNTEKIRLFGCYLMLYYYESRKKKLYMPIDFEFNKKRIELIQINFDIDKIIFIVNPNEFEQKLLNFFIKYILENQSITKILHGSDALDIPYIFDRLLESNSTKIINFVNSVVDTRFMCEYVKNTKNEERICGIYKTLFYFHTINQMKYDYLSDIDKQIKLQDHSWNIHILNKIDKLYALYDVIYLKKLLENIIGSVEENEKIIFKNIIPELTRFIFLEKRGITNILEYMKKKVNEFNNLSISNIKFQKKYEQIIDKLVIHSPTIRIKDLLYINYFRTPMNIFCKTVIYHTLLYKYHQSVDNKIEIKPLYNYMDKYEYKYIKKLIQFIHIQVNKFL